MSQTYSIRELYTTLKERAKARAATYAMIDVVIRLRDGLKSPHAKIVMGLFWWHVFLTDRPLYSRLKNATNEAEMRQMFGGKVVTAYVQGQKVIAVDSSMFPDEFFEIIDAYLDLTDENS